MNMRNYSQLSTDFPLITFRLLELRYLVINFTSLPHRQSHACPKHVRLFRNIERTIFSHGEHSDHRFMCALLNYVPLGRNDLPFFPSVGVDGWQNLPVGLKPHSSLKNTSTHKHSWRKQHGCLGGSSSFP